LSLARVVRGVGAREQKKVVHNGAGWSPKGCLKNAGLDSIWERAVGSR